MTTIADYLESIRQSLASIEQSTDTTQAPSDESLRHLDAAAFTIAQRYRRRVTGRLRRVPELAAGETP